MTQKTTTRTQEWQGTVVADAADKTVSVAVTRYVTHPKYLKKYRVTKKYAVHDPENRYHVGDVVRFRATAPISRTKRFLALYQPQN